MFYGHSKFLLELPERAPEFVSFARIFNYIPFSQQVVSVSVILFSTTLLFLLVRPSIFTSAVVALLFLPLVSVKFSYGKIPHSSHVWLMTLTVLPFFNYKSLNFEHQDKICLRVCQGILLSSYFSAGLWKLRHLWGKNPLDAVKDHIAYSVAEGGTPVDLIGSLPWMYSDEVLATGFGIVILFQLFSFAPLIFERLTPWWGIAALVFHLSTGVYLDLFFKEMAVIAVLLLFVGPAMANKSRGENGS